MDEPHARKPVAVSRDTVAPEAAPPGEGAPRCDGCAVEITGEPAGWGVLLWSRGEERREERVPLCEDCATAIGVVMAFPLDDDEDE